MKKIILAVAVLALFLMLPIVIAEEGASVVTAVETADISVEVAAVSDETVTAVSVKKTMSESEKAFRERLELARAEYMEQIQTAKEKFESRREALKSEYEVHVKNFEEKRDELKTLKKKYDGEVAVNKEELKAKIRTKAFDALYERLKASMKKLETLEEKELISAEASEAIRAKMTAIKIRLGAGEFTKEELISISKEINSLFKNISVSGKTHVAKALSNKIASHIKSAKNAAEKVQKAIDRMKEKGLDTSKAESALASFNEQIAAAETAFESAKASVAAAETKEDKHAALKVAFEDFKETAKELKDAFHSLKQAIREVLSEAKGSSGSEDETEDESDNEAEESEELEA